MPLTSALKHWAAHFWRRPGFPSGRAWLWVQVWACVAAWVGTGVGAVPQQFPEASEDNHFIFRSDGTYSFSYDTGGGQHQSFRIETRDSAGRVSGRFGYVDPDGVLRITEYQADTEGYRANMEIYHLVSWFPRSPLLVGPLPQPPSEAEDLPDLHEAPQQTTNGPVGTPLFFPPEGPVLIIGPLPKPLQPPRDLMDQEPPSLTQEALLGASLSTVLPPPPLNFLQGPATQDLSQSSPPQILQEGILNALLQDSLEDVLQESVADLLSSSAMNTSLGISNNTLQDTDLPSESFQSTDGQDLLGGLEQMNLRSDMQKSSPTSPTISLSPDEDSASRSPPSNNVDNTATTASKEPVSNTTVTVSVQELPDPSTNNSSQERQDNSNISDASTTGAATTTTTGAATTTTTGAATTTTTGAAFITTTSTATGTAASAATTTTTGTATSTTTGTATTTTTSTTISTTTSFTTSIATITLSRVNSEATTMTQLTMSASPQVTTKVSPQLTTLARPQLTITTASQPTTSTRTRLTTSATPQLTTKRTSGLTTTTESTRASSATVTWSLSPSGAGGARSGQESGRYHSATFPPVLALTYLPVAEDSYGTPSDVYSHLPQAFNPFFWD